MTSKDNFQLVDIQGWDWDLHSVYSAYIGHFQSHGVPWYDRSWGHLFSSFEDFLTFGWPTVTVTDARTGKAHIVTRAGSVNAFAKMVKTRFGETLPKISNVLQIVPFEHSQRHLRQINDMATYRKVHATLPAAEFSAFKSRVKHGDLNGRKGHFVVAEYADKVRNKIRPTHPWEYAFGDTHVISKSKLPDIINSVISSLATPDSESVANSLVLVGHNISGDLERLTELKIKIPHNMLIVDTAVASLRHAVFGPQLPREAPLARLLAAQARAPRCTLGNAGNDAWLALGAMIALIDKNATPLNSATIGGANQSPIPRPPPLTSESSGNIPQIHARYSSAAFPSGSPLPFPSNPSTDMLPLPSPNANPNARPISAVFARPRTGSAGPVGMGSPRNSLSLNGMGAALPTPNSNLNTRPISMVMNRSMSGSPRNSLSLQPGSPGLGEFGDFRASSGGAISKSWNGRSALANGRPATPLGLGGPSGFFDSKSPSSGGFDTKPGAGRKSKLVISPSVKPEGGDESTESESEDDYEPRESGEMGQPLDRGRTRFL
ncbi:hypothetical protein RhiJN_08040 [Ceratobasidium sp. AG-Ba]|nr:hypothetical protein RhiJN_08040 [Ceratobasidium sp. AG-Ba]